jgi:putative ABC transport system ATP-binding protein
MIALENIDFKYPDSDFQLQIDALSFQQGTRTAVIGPSGFGKTTLLNLISGISLPQKGRIRIDGTLVNLLSDAERRTFRLVHIGFVFQDFKLLDYLTVMDNILLPFRINRALTSDKNTRARARRLVSMLNIESKLTRYPGKLSQGERQRVAICRALINDPPIILADEPTGNLDPENKLKIMDMLFDYVKDQGASLLTVTHDHELLTGFDSVVDFKNLYTTT